uniref:HTH CENPB-type domain-containing protein n=1 Tax=Scleropages formosus TaxID=113540 RepID=A0A8C9R0F3_SCLFO
MRRHGEYINLKLEVIKRLERGERNRDICKALRLSSSTVRTIYLNKDKIQKTAESVVDGAKLKTVLKARHPLYEKLESLLLQWIEDQLSRSTILSYIEGDERVIDMEFKASHGWFERFKKRAYLHNLRLTNDAAPEDIEAARVFPGELLKIIQAGDYHPKQIFNIDETWLFWKRMMSGTLISQEEKKGTGHVISKDRLTLLLGGNLHGDVKLKPLIVYHSQNPRALKGINRNSLPVFWRSNKKGCMTQQVFYDYVQNYFCPLVEKYCRENSFSNKALLIIDSAPGHPTTVIGYGDNVQVVFLPANSSSLLLQPMEQGVISTFKAYYMQLVMKYLVDGLDSNSNLTIKELWKNYNMKIAIENIATAWEKIPEETMNAVWMKLLPEFVHDVKGFESVEKTIKEDIVKLAYRAGFEQVHTEDVEEVLDSHTEELTNEELIHSNPAIALLLFSDTHPQFSSRNPAV